MHSSNYRWDGNQPGGIGKLNTFFIPPEFDGDMPVIKKYTGRLPESLVPFRGIPRSRQACHYFLDDYRFECVWNRPYVYMERYKGKLTFTPDFSLYTNYPLMVQRWNTYRNRWIGSYFQESGVHVIPTISWGDERSYDFCFKGVPRKSVVAISTRGCSRFKESFTQGFDAMVEHIDPELIICAGKISKVYLGEHDLNNVVTYIIEHETLKSNTTFCYRSE